MPASPPCFQLCWKRIWTHPPVCHLNVRLFYRPLPAHHLPTLPGAGASQVPPLASWTDDQSCGLSCCYQRSLCPQVRRNDHLLSACVSAPFHSLLHYPQLPPNKQASCQMSPGASGVTQTGLGHAALGCKAGGLSCSLRVSAGAPSAWRLLDLCARCSFAGSFSGEASIPLCTSGQRLPHPVQTLSSEDLQACPFLTSDCRYLSGQLRILWDSGPARLPAWALSCPFPGSFLLPASGFLQCFRRPSASCLLAPQVALPSAWKLPPFPGKLLFFS